MNKDAKLVLVWHFFWNSIKKNPPKSASSACKKRSDIFS